MAVAKVSVEASSPPATSPPAGPPRGRRRGRRPRLSADLLQRRPGEIPGVVVRVTRTRDVLGLEVRRLVPQEGDGRSLLDDHLVDVGPGLGALVAGERRGLVHGLVDRRVLEL